MKKLSITQMEELIGGGYCETLYQAAHEAFIDWEYGAWMRITFVYKKHCDLN